MAYSLSLPEQQWPSVRAGILAYNWTATHRAGLVVVVFATRAGYQQAVKLIAQDGGKH